MALDYIQPQAEGLRDCTLLLVHEGIAVYHTLSNTNVKILVGIDAQDNSRYDLKTVYISCVSRIS